MTKQNKAVEDHRAQVKLILFNEANRYTAIAQDLALKVITEPNAGDVEKKKRLACEHVIRAETFKAAINLI